MSIPLKYHPKAWPLDYHWSKRGGKWDDFTDVMLEGRLCAIEDGLALLQRWVDAQQHDNAKVDGEPRRIFYAGGVQGYICPRAPDRLEIETMGFATAEREACSIYLHSHGQDAFDSLHHYSAEISAALRQTKQPLMLRWIEQPHKRKDHQLQWP